MARFRREGLTQIVVVMDDCDIRGSVGWLYIVI